MKKFLAQILLPLIFMSNVISPIVYGLSTNGSSSPWTRDKATHLARSVLFYASPEMIDSLERAGSASAAVNILFPDVNGPDRSAFDAFVTNYTASGFNWGDGNHAIRLYQLLYAADPYEAKRKLFSLFEDIFSVSIDNERGITYKDINEQQSLIYANMFGNYQNLVKKILYNNGNPGDFAEGSYLDLFNQQDPKNPNENYARELLQLFLMGEYEPFKSKENEDIRNYEESDVKALARILTGLKSDPMNHRVTFDINTHYTGSGLVFLSGAISGMNPSYYNSASGTVDPTLITMPTLGNNGLTDNVIEYIFAKRSRQIALFLADRIYRFYIHDTPTRAELDTIAGVIESNNFDMFASIKTVLTLDMMYSDKAMNDVHYKNPLELTIGTIKLLQGNSFSNIILDPNVYDTNLLRRLGWTPYFPGSIFGRDGFDNSLKWMSTSNQNAWMSATNYFAYRNGTGAVNFRTLLGNYRKELTTESISLVTNGKNNFTGSLIVIGGTLDANPPTTGNASTGTNMNSANNSGTGGTGTSGTGTGGTGSGTTNTNNTGSGNTGSGDTGTNNSGTTDTSNSNTGSGGTGSGTTDTSNTGSRNTGSGNTGSGNTGTNNSGSTDTNTSNTGSSQTGTTDASNSGSSNSGTTSISFSLSGGTDTGANMMFGAEMIASGITDIHTGSVSLPNFSINTDVGIITIASGTYDASRKTLIISSGSINNSGSITPIYSGSLFMSQSSVLSADVLSADDLIDIFGTHLLGDIPLPTTVRAMIRTFLTTDENNNPLGITPSTNEYYDKKIRGLVSILLSQPEYVLLRGATLPTTTNTSSNHFLDNITGKLIFIELYGGNDYLSSIIPKDEYSTYLDYRTNSSGSIAITGNNLVDIGNFYMNSALAYGSGGGAGFKSLYDEGSLKIFNRVGGYRHSQDHDAAAKQISSYTDTTAASAEGLFGHLVDQEFESSHTISLGAKMPNLYRGGHYVNMGGSVILSNPLNGSIKQHMDLLANMMQNRTYPSDTRSLFSDAGRISDIAKVSANAGGPSGANGDMNNIFRFTKILMQNNIGRAYYMGGYGGYDTHGDQLNGLNRNLNFVSTAVTNFFNDVKNTQDVTIVIFSEFGRTNKVNGSLGTDHGDGGGMFVITSNQNLKNLLQTGTYGNMSIKNAKANSLGIGIDYRSIYGKVFEGLYGLDGKTYFQDSKISLENDTSTAANTISLLSYSYQASGRNVVMNGEFSVTGSNYNPGKAGYTRLLSGTGTNALKNTSLSTSTTPLGYTYRFRLNSSSQPYFQIQSFSNQYALTEVNSTLTGMSVPMIMSNSTRNISQTGSSILPVFNNTSTPRIFAGTGVVLSNTGTSEMIPGNNPDFAIQFHTGITQVTELTTSSGTLTWNGGFLLGENIDKNVFVPLGARITGSGTSLERSQVIRLIKIGADTLGVGMKLNQPVVIGFKNIPDLTQSYRVLTSENGIDWSDVEQVGKEYRPSATGSITVMVDHFSYFALVSTTALPTELPPSCTVNITPSTAYNGTVAQMTWNLTNASTGVLSPGNSIIGSMSGMTNILPPTSATTTYTITVTNSAGSSSCNATITTIATPGGGGSGSGTTGSGSGSGTGGTNTNTGTNTNSPNTPVTGPGGGGGSRPTYIPIRTKMLDICVDGDFSGDAYDGSCELPSEPSGKTKDIPVETGVYTIESDIVNFVNSYSMSEKSENEKNQLGWQVSLNLWKSMANTAPLSRTSKLQETYTLLYGEVQKTDDRDTRKALMKIMQNLQFLADSSEKAKPREIVKNPKSEGKIQYVTAENSLAIRSSTKIDNNIVGYLGHNQMVEVLGNFGEWTKIRSDAGEGYVKSSYLRDGEPIGMIENPYTPPTSNDGKGWVQVKHTAFIRRGSRYDAQIVGVAHDGDEVMILSEKSGWLEVLWNGVHGYIAKWLVKKQ